MTRRFPARTATSLRVVSLLCAQVSSQGVGPGGSVEVELVGTSQHPFLGFLVQARDTVTDKPVGFFTLQPGAPAKYVNCANNRQVGTYSLLIPDMYS